MEDELNLKWKTKKNKKNLFLISLKFRVKPFLGLAQLSEIFLKYYTFEDEDFLRMNLIC